MAKPLAEFTAIHPGLEEEEGRALVATLFEKRTPSTRSFVEGPPKTGSEIMQLLTRNQMPFTPSYQLDPVEGRSLQRFCEATATYFPPDAQTGLPGFFLLQPPLYKPGNYLCAIAVEMVDGDGPRIARVSFEIRAEVERLSSRPPQLPQASGGSRRLRSA